MADTRDELIARLRQRLLASANQAGWGYTAGKVSRIEPTCWALIALAYTAPATDQWPSFAADHLGFLKRLQQPDGLLSETEPALCNLAANGLAALVLGNDVVAPSHADEYVRLIEGLVRLKGVRLEPVDPRQDSTLQGWPWVPETFSWVEPTAWCLLALKRAARSPDREGIRARCVEAERLLANRMCNGGGWNFGNALALGQDLRPYVPTTAVALMALQSASRSTTVQTSLIWLEAERLSEPGAMTLALTSICLRLYGAQTIDVDERLATIVEQSERGGNLLATALALCALTGSRHQGDMFRVA
ncbi:MAG: hypothetical protein U0Q11_09280 [Vicinamibacterales bacterium]